MMITALQLDVGSDRTDFRSINRQLLVTIDQRELGASRIATTKVQHCPRYIFDARNVHFDFYDAGFLTEPSQAKCIWSDFDRLTEEHFDL